jgi:hypothetical protein
MENVQECYLAPFSVGRVHVQGHVPLGQQTRQRGEANVIGRVQSAVTSSSEQEDRITK